MTAMTHSLVATGTPEPRAAKDQAKPRIARDVVSAR
jgi:hypothetical protein